MIKNRIFYLTLILGVFLYPGCAKQIVNRPISYDLYELALLDQNEERFPERILIHNSDIGPFIRIAKAAGLKDKIFDLLNRPEWEFVSNYKGPEENKSIERIRVKDILQNKRKLLTKNFSFTFTPIFYSSSGDQALFGYDIFHNGTAEQFILMFADKKNGKWLIVYREPFFLN